LCKELRDNEISAVAITDHFLIDKDRIKHLRELAPDIVFFPGVELRTDKGSDNLHLILLFSETADIDILSQDFESAMKRGKAKAKDNDETIYWIFEDIVEFCKEHDGLISIHAGKKTNGIDEQIPNALPVQQAIKADIADNIDFFEVGRKKDIDVYYRYVFQVVEEKPIIMCSDCHDSRKYTTKESLWIKANLTFEGLKQCLYQPKERIYIGTIPPALDRVKKNRKVNMDVLSVHRIQKPNNDGVCWFDFDLPLNAGLVAIIGNKGSGKSAFADIMGQVCKCKTMGSASFLNSNRFRKMPKNYAGDYVAKIKWKDGHEEEKRLDIADYETVIEDAQYLPQKYIEEVCNDIGNVFQEEIDKVIYSYVDRTERGSSTNLTELVKLKSQDINYEMLSVQMDIKELNEHIIQLEKKKTTQYHALVNDSLKKYKENLDRHERNKPQEINKPEPKEENLQYQEALQKINVEIEELSKAIEQVKDELTQINSSINDTQQVIRKLRLLKSEFDDTTEILRDYLEKYPLEGVNEQLQLKLPVDVLEVYKNKLSTEKATKQLLLNGSELGKGLVAKLDEAQCKKKELISTADNGEKRYQKYLSDLQEWEDEKQRIIGNSETENCLAYFEAEKSYLEENLEEDYNIARIKRNTKFKELYMIKNKIISVFEEIYSPIESEITKLLGGLEDTIEF